MERQKTGRKEADSASWVKIDGHQRPWAASRLEQGIAPPRRPRSGGVTAAPQVPSQRRCRPSGRAVIRTCRRCPCEAVPRCCVIVPRGDLRGISPCWSPILGLPRQPRVPRLLRPDNFVISHFPRRRLCKTWRVLYGSLLPASRLKGNVLRAKAAPGNPARLVSLAHRAPFHCDLAQQIRTLRISPSRGRLRDPFLVRVWKHRCASALRASRI